ncbi:MAG TPA: bifunctional DNA-binding transcriptional regulator/O6-methylguanine-DNA methyltransferase Ada [Acidobacteriaceae bacterium]|nr:bifunctional DNA-binding transcriptional regulator/O6-methylguanine-DNA methyltransferase Ada [Acidobacteriaceae bacterium]
MIPSAMLPEDQAWAAVLARDPAADAEMVYAVRTTGVFCRPTCPSRRPARTHVVFFPDSDSAIHAGYRPCRRCRPQLPHPDAALVEAISAKLGTDRAVTLEELSRTTGRSPFTIERAFRRVLGITPAQYQRQRRAASFRRELATGSARVTDAIYDAGYSGPGRAYETAQLGMAPGKFRSGGKDAQIGYAIGDGPLGKVLVAATERGLCSVILGDHEAQMTRELRAQFPAAGIHADPNLEPHLRKVLSQFTSHPAALDLPLDLRATAFQMRVWEALRRIPRGQTRSYSQVAQSLGQPTAVRAVARACATNPVAVIIPCHRVIGSNGKPTGYRWGVKRKEQLLELEAKTGPRTP